MLSQDQADQVEQILCCLQKEHTEHLHHLLDTYTNHQATIGKDTVNICYFLNAEFEFSRIPRRNLYILSFPDDCRQDWFLGLSQANDLVYALPEGWATSRESLVDAFLVYGIQFYTLSPVPPPSEMQHLPKSPPIPMSSSNAPCFRMHPSQSHSNLSRKSTRLQNTRSVRSNSSTCVLQLAVVVWWQGCGDAISANMRIG